MNIISNCVLCNEHSLHIIGEKEYESQQCINCGYVSSEKFKLNNKNVEENESYQQLTDQLKKWSKVENDRIWIPTILTLPFGMLYPLNVDNMVDHKVELKWAFADMVDIPEEERKNYPVDGDSNKFYERRIDVDNAKMYDDFLEAMAYINQKTKKLSEPPKSVGIKLPKLKKINLDE